MDKRSLFGDSLGTNRQEQTQTDTLTPSSFDGRGRGGEVAPILRPVPPPFSSPPVNGSQY